MNTLARKPALERKKEVEEIGVMVKKNGNKRSILCIIMLFLMLSREVRGRSEAGGQESRKSGRRRDGRLTNRSPINVFELSIFSS